MLLIFLLKERSSSFEFRAGGLFGVVGDRGGVSGEPLQVVGRHVVERLPAITAKAELALGARFVELGDEGGQVVGSARGDVELEALFENEARDDHVGQGAMGAHVF